MRPRESERERILTAMVEALKLREPKRFGDERHMAEICLGVLENPASDAKPQYVICTCGQNGYKPGSVHSNHDHLEGCPHYEGSTSRPVD